MSIASLHPTASATWAPAGHGMAAHPRATHTGGPPPSWWAQTVAPAPAARSLALPSKVASRGQLASSHAGAGFQGARTSSPGRRAQVTVRQAHHSLQRAHRSTLHTALAAAGATQRGRGHQPGPGRTQEATWEDAKRRATTVPAATASRGAGRQTIRPAPVSPPPVSAGPADDQRRRTSGTPAQAQSGPSAAQAWGSSPVEVPGSGAGASSSSAKAPEWVAPQERTSQAAAFIGVMHARPRRVLWRKAT